MWTSGDESQLLELRARGLKWTQIAEELGRGAGADSCRKRYAQLMMGGCQPAPKLTESDQKRSIEVLRRENDALSKALLEERYRTRMIIEGCKDEIVKRSLDVSCVPRFKPVKKRLAQEAHLNIGDVHYGKVVDPTTVSGLSKYDTEICRQQLTALCDKFLTFWHQDSPQLGLQKVVLAFLGDILDGNDVYPGHAYHVEMAASRQVFAFAHIFEHDFLIPVLRDANIECIEMPCVLGNHGRTGKKGESHILNNWDFMFYMVLQLLSEKYGDRVKVYVSECPMMVMQHGNFTFLYQHGDSVKGWMGVPYYGLSRQAGKLNKMFGHIDYQISGHCHTPGAIDHGAIIINGAFPGGDELSINAMNVNGVPSQKLWYFDPVHGINRTSDLHLREPEKLTADHNRIFTPYIGGMNESEIRL